MRPLYDVMPWLLESDEAWKKGNLLRKLRCSSNKELERWEGRTCLPTLSFYAANAADAVAAATERLGLYGHDIKFEAFEIQS